MKRERFSDRKSLLFCGMQNKDEDNVLTQSLHVADRFFLYPDFLF